MATKLRELPPNIHVLSDNHTDCDPEHDKSGCVMNLVAWVCGYEEITDTPPCASDILTSYAIKLNDSISDELLRTELMLPLVYKLAGSKASQEVEQKRLYFLVDKAVRVFAPIALDAVNLHDHDHAQKLRELSPIVDQQSAATAVRSAASAARYAAAAAAAASSAASSAAAVAAADVYKLAAQTLSEVCGIVA